MATINPEQTLMPNPQLRRPPFAGGPSRVPEEAPAPHRKPTLMKKLMPYLIAGGSTGAGIGFGWFFS